MNVRGVRKHPEARRLGLPLQQLHAIIEERDVATELVDGEPAKQRALFRRQQMCRADHRREHAAALDIGHEDPGRLNARHQAEVDQVVLAQIQLGDAARPFDDDRVEAAGQIVIGREHDRSQLVGVRVVLASGERLPQTAVHDHLAAPVSTRLEQNRIHRRLRLEPARFGLRDLRAPNLSSRAAWVGVVGHVLRLEGRDRQPAVPEPRADGGGHPALAGIRGCPANEQRPRRHP